MDQMQQQFNVFHLPQLPQQTFIGALEAGSNMQSLWPLFTPLYQDLIKHAQHSQTIYFSQVATLHPIDEMPNPEKDIDMVYQFGRCNLFVGIRALIEVLRGGNVQKNVVILLVLDESVFNQTQWTTFEPHLEHFRQISQRFSIYFHLFCFNPIPLQILTLIKNSFDLKSNQIMVRGLYKCDLLQKLDIFAEVRHSLFFGSFKITNNVRLFPQGNCFNAQHFSPYVITDASEKSIKFSLQVGRIEYRFPFEFGSIYAKNVLTGEDVTGIVEMLKIYIIRGLKIQKPIHIEQGLLDFIQRKLNMEVVDKLLIRDIANELDKLDFNSFKRRLSMVNGNLTPILERSLLFRYGETQHDFQRSKLDLFLLAKKELINLKSSDQDRSTVNFINQKDVFEDPEYQDLLMQIESPWDAVTLFPIVGQGLEVSKKKPSEANRASFWNITIKSIPMLSSTYDQTCFHINPSGEIRIPVQGGVDIVNCVLPLYSSSDNDLRPFIQSEFFDTMMTMIVYNTQNIRITEAHAALSSYFLIHLLQKPPSEWRNHQIDLIYNTFNMKYSDYEPFNMIKKQLLSDQPGFAFISPLEIETVPPALIILLMLILSREQPVKFKRNFQQILYYLILSCFESMGSSYQSNKQLTITKYNELLVDIAEQIKCSKSTIESLLYTITGICYNLDLSSYAEGYQVNLAPIAQDQKWSYEWMSSAVVADIYKYFVGENFPSQLYYTCVLQQQEYSIKRLDGYLQPMPNYEKTMKDIRRTMFQSQFDYKNFSQQIMFELMQIINKKQINENNKNRRNRGSQSFLDWFIVTPFVRVLTIIKQCSKKAQKRQRKFE